MHADPSPFHLGPARAEAGVLLLHGFTGTPFEMRLLGEALGRRGFAIEGPALAGHCGSTAELAATGWRQWLASAETALDMLRSRARRVGICGLSMGGLLALELTRRHASEVAALAALSTPLWLPPGAERFARLVTRVPVVCGWALPKLAGSDISDREMRRLNRRAAGRAGMPFLSLLSLVELGYEVRRNLGEVRAPALLIHSRLDHTVPFACLDALAAGLGSTDLKRLALARSFHVITLDVERGQVEDAVAAHFSSHLV